MGVCRFSRLVAGGVTEGVMAVAVRRCCEEVSRTVDRYSTVLFAHVEKISKNRCDRSMLFEVSAGILDGNISAI